MTSPLKPLSLSMMLISNQSSGLPCTLEQNHMGLCKWNWRFVQSISVWSTTSINIIIHSFICPSIYLHQILCLYEEYHHTIMLSLYQMYSHVFTVYFRYISSFCPPFTETVTKKEKMPIFLLFICIYLINWCLHVL